MSMAGPVNSGAAVVNAATMAGRRDLQAALLSPFLLRGKVGATRAGCLGDVRPHADERRHERVEQNAGSDRAPVVGECCRHRAIGLCRAERHHPLRPSEQHLVDCDRRHQDRGAGQRQVGQEAEAVAQLARAVFVVLKIFRSRAHRDGGKPCQQRRRPGEPNAHVEIDHVVELIESPRDDTLGPLGHGDRIVQNASADEILLPVSVGHRNAECSGREESTGPRVKPPQPTHQHEAGERHRGSGRQQAECA